MQNKIRAELDKMRAMTWRERLGYIKDYYSMTFLMILIVVILIVAVVQGIQNRGKDDFLNLAVLEYTGVYSRLEEAGAQYAETLKAQSAEEITEDAQVVVYDNSDITAAGLQTGHSYQKFQGLSAQMSVGDVDVIFMTEDMLRFLQKTRDSYFVPLDELYSAEELAEFGERVYMLTDENSEEYPAAVDVSGWEVLKAAVTEDEPLYAAVVIGARHEKRAADFLKYFTGV